MPFDLRSQLDSYRDWQLAQAPYQHARQSLVDPEHRRVIYRIAVAQSASARLARQVNP